eukprot:NODE_111_length_18624_cov_1.285020.p11 type:complete len:187 gc:universal NODE_111_length_18624_cov_1.285020:1484-924(-)
MSQDSQPSLNQSEIVYQGLSDTCKGSLTGYIACVNERVNGIRNSNNSYMPTNTDFKVRICPNCAQNATNLQNNCKDGDIKANPRVVNFLVQCHQEQSAFCVDNVYSDISNGQLADFTCSPCQKYLSTLLVAGGVTDNNISDSNSTWKKSEVKSCAANGTTGEANSSFKLPVLTCFIFGIMATTILQ